jgi:uncharacterized protein YcfJ
MHVEYDSGVVTEFADRLYAQAKNIIVSYTILGALVFGAVGGLGAAATGRAYEALVGAITLGFIGGAIGYARGRERAYTLKLQAQTALCQVRIEENTRPR